MHIFFRNRVVQNVRTSSNASASISKTDFLDKIHKKEKSKNKNKIKEVDALEKPLEKPVANRVNSKLYLSILIFFISFHFFLQAIF